MQAVIVNTNDKTMRPANIMAVAVETAFLDGLSFNAIQTFEEQEKEVDKVTLIAITEVWAVGRPAGRPAWPCVTDPEDQSLRQGSRGARA
jgi:hypothetical protein